MKKSIIVAMAENRVIGRNNKLPWYLPNDLKYFKSVTMGKPVIMGRKTFESIGKPLPGRLNIVITRNADWSHPGVTVVHTIEDAFSKAEATALIDGVDEVMIIGGDQIYQTALSLADRIYLTKVHAEVDGDAWFTDVDWDQWEESAREDFMAEDPNPYDYSFIVYDRK
ncbi:dihydrofolate reductase [Alkalimarinus coralli]|uniref:dihydrofolate reductase n=1 Tax=Alkalimarinus coralli TaxID=2935863 RepID=UPI00202AE02C|nr:dihydrofolate reductase [Alkalimarinus coralli]